MILIRLLIYSILLKTASVLGFVFVVPTYNNEEYCEKNLRSIIEQKTDRNFEVIICNDCSTDKTGEKIKEFIKKNNLNSIVTLIENNKRLGALHNIYNIVHSLSDDKIVILVDGDDCLAHENVLERVAREYDNAQVWLTYGQFMTVPFGYHGQCQPIPSEVLINNSFRSAGLCISHLRTFKAGLFKKIKKEDLLHESDFYPMAWDVAMLLPMLEMASEGAHIAFIPDILYLYNCVNPISDHNVNYGLQRNLDKLIRSKKKYEPINEI